MFISWAGVSGIAQITPGITRLIRATGKHSVVGFSFTSSPLRPASEITPPQSRFNPVTCTAIVSNRRTFFEASCRLDSGRLMANMAGIKAEGQTDRPQLVNRLSESRSPYVSTLTRFDASPFRRDFIDMMVGAQSYA